MPEPVRSFDGNGWSRGSQRPRAYRSDVRISLGYKLNEARNYIILGNMDRALYLCARLGMPHVGVTGVELLLARY